MESEAILSSVRDTGKALVYLGEGREQISNNILKNNNRIICNLTFYLIILGHSVSMKVYSLILFNSSLLFQLMNIPCIYLIILQLMDIWFIYISAI